MKVHPVADLFPFLEGAEFRALTEDIKEHGLRDPIVLHRDGSVLDGRNRWLACEAAKVEPRFVPFKGKDSEVLAFVLSMNLRRRHLDKSQRAMIAARLATMKQGRPGKETNSSISIPQAAKMLNIGATSVKAARSLREASPDLAGKVERGNLTLHGAVSQSKALAAREQARQAAKDLESMPPSEVCRIEVATMQDFLAGLDPGSVGAIITDPPYGKAAVPLYEELARGAARVLKPGTGVLAVMCGHSTLDDVMAVMTKHLPFRWIIALILGGPRFSRMWPGGHLCRWKPILIFGAHTRFASDLIQGDGTEKGLHPWQQGVDDMLQVVEMFTKPGAVVCDPFCGSGTTAVAARRLGRRFVGCDVDPETVEIARGRVAKEVAEGATDTSDAAQGATA